MCAEASLAKISFVVPMQSLKVTLKIILPSVLLQFIGELLLITPGASTCVDEVGIISLIGKKPPVLLF